MEISESDRVEELLMRLQKLQTSSEEVQKEAVSKIAPGMVSCWFPCKATPNRVALRRPSLPGCLMDVKEHFEFARLRAGSTAG